ncbi:DUF2267 domain-containing protein [Natronococcus pandeyae]|uniref:DUF2267 domain-containing protein n=1 Tax=Natronococcus pandeyae TaxID=2055836 RepID=A0A8J8Q631_9EURY|nr:DUF2267 domain-containing protein [Natronococcus pandeyae]TYL39492.1 DUF2267 domain-containing protein [Natronococcus pandeyae]
MERHDFYQAVEQRANLADETDARNATQAVCSALGERLEEHQSHQLADDLPEEINDHLTDGASGRRLSYEEFRSRVEERTDRAEIGDPERLSRAVVETLFEHVDDEEADDLRERLEEFGYDEIVPDS